MRFTHKYLNFYFYKSKKIRQNSENFSTCIVLTNQTNKLYCLSIRIVNIAKNGFDFPFFVNIMHNSEPQ